MYFFCQLTSKEITLFHSVEISVAFLCEIKHNISCCNIFTVFLSLNFNKNKISNPLIRSISKETICRQIMLCEDSEHNF